MRHFRGTLSSLLVVWIVLALGTLSCTTAQGGQSSVGSEQHSVTLAFLTSPVSRGNAASITVKTVPGAACAITVTYKSGPSRAQGLVPKTAEESGFVGWAWIVGTRTTPGMWPITVTCSAGGRQATLETSFLVQ